MPLRMGSLVALASAIAGFPSVIYRGLCIMCLAWCALDGGPSIENQACGAKGAWPCWKDRRVVRACPCHAPFVGESRGPCVGNHRVSMVGQAVFHRLCRLRLQERVLSTGNELLGTLVAESCMLSLGPSCSWWVRAAICPSMCCVGAFCALGFSHAKRSCHGPVQRSLRSPIEFFLGLVVGRCVRILPPLPMGM